MCSVGMMACYHRRHEWRAYMDGMLLSLLLLLKYYPEEQNVECLLLKKKRKMFQIDFHSDLKEEPDLKSRRLVYTFWTGNARTLNMPESTELCPNVGKYSSIRVTKNVTL